MYSSLKDKIALITGAGTGIGYAIARSLASAGGRVVLNDVNPELAARASEGLSREYPGSCLPFPGDAGSIDIIDQMISFTLSEFGQINSVIANAGLTMFGDFFDFKPGDFEKIVRLNLQGSFFLTQRAARRMRDQGSGGRVILMSSITGIQSYPDLSAYSMTKAALQMMARNLVLALAPHGITINAVAPGATLTERTRQEEPDYEGTWSRLVPLGDVGRPEDMANACLFLLSDQASHITGQTLVVDGGWTVAGRYPGDLK